MKGVKGVLPLGCLPLWGSEGVTLIAAEENNQTIEEMSSQESNYSSQPKKSNR